jgi:divinyl chlorophyllide a 8-vinyl-reductase
MSASKRVLLIGATGTIGLATAQALVARGHRTTAIVRPHARDGVAAAVPHMDVRVADVTDAASMSRDGLRGNGFDVLVSCLASRTGAPRDAWSIDHDAHVVALETARAAGVGHVVLLSAICVQQPRLAFQHAKLAFEGKLRASGLTWSIVRPTAYFKSLSGQVARVKAGQPFMVFEDGRLTACKPISNRDLADYLVGCLDDPARWNRILPIGGPGPAITPLDQAHALFALLGRAPRIRHVPVRLLDAIVGGLSLAGHVSRRAADKAEFARIGRYYATHSMLVWDEAAQRYDAVATPETGRDTLPEFYAQLIRGEATLERGDHAVF